MWGTCFSTDCQIFHWEQILLHYALTSAFTPNFGDYIFRIYEINDTTDNMKSASYLDLNKNDDGKIPYGKTSRQKRWLLILYCQYSFYLLLPVYADLYHILDVMPELAKTMLTFCIVLHFPQ